MDLFHNNMHLTKQDYVLFVHNQAYVIHDLVFQLFNFTQFFALVSFSPQKCLINYAFYIGLNMHLNKKDGICGKHNQAQIMHDVCICVLFHLFLRAFNQSGSNCTLVFDTIGSSQLAKMVCMACVIRHKLCMIYAFPFFVFA